MKDYLSDLYGDEKKPSYDKLREWVKEAWEVVPDEVFVGLLSTMKERCEDVIAANGIHTKW